MRQKVAGCIHQVDARFVVFNADMHMQAEDQVGARDHLEIFHNDCVTLVRIDLLFAPVGKRMRGGRGDAQIVLLRQVTHLRTKGFEFRGGFLDVAADAGADLDHGLVHLGFHRFFQQHLAFSIISESMCDRRSGFPGRWSGTLLRYLN